MSGEVVHFDPDLAVGSGRQFLYELSSLFTRRACGGHEEPQGDSMRQAGEYGVQLVAQWSVQ
jgi:hypothetical protein